MRRVLGRALVVAVALVAAACGDEEKPAPKADPVQKAPAPRRPAVPAPERRRAPELEEPAPSAVELGRVEGVVTTGDADAPVADFPVHLLGAFTADDLPLAETTTTSDGTFAFDGVPAGNARIVALGSRDGVEQRDEQTVAVAARATVKSRLRLRAPAEAGGGIEVRGSVVWSDTGEPVAKFEFGLWLSTRDARHATRVVGENGRFRVVLPVEGKWRTTQLVADGENHRDFFEEVVAARGVEATLRVPRPGEARVRIVDAVTGAPLSGAQAYPESRDREGPFFDARHQVPSRSTLAREPLTADADGQIPLGRGSGTTQFYVVADGHEWMAVEVAFGGGRQEVRLREAGSLHLSIPRWRELESATLDTDVGSPGRMRLPPPDRNGELIVPGLLPGTHTITVRRGRWFEDGIEYGSGEVQIVARAEAHLTIDADPGERRTKVTVTGTLVVPEAWGDLPRGMTLDGAEKTNAETTEFERLEAPASGRVLTFRFEGIAEGRYRLEVDPFQWRREVVVGPGATNWSLDLGAPAELVVKVLSDATGAAAPGAELSWYTLLEGQNGWSRQEAERRGSDGAFVVRVPAGTVHLDAEAPGLVDASETTEATAGGTTGVTIRLKGGTTLIVKLEFDGKPFTAKSPTVWVSRTIDETSTTSQGHSASDGEARFEGAAPGTCSVSVWKSEIDGWTCTEETVELRVGETKTVVLKLEKKR